MIFNNIEITDISNDFKGLCFVKGKKCFVEGGITGDIVDLDIYKKTSKYYLAKIVNILKKSTFRNNCVECEFFENCGGCIAQHIQYNYYKELKKNYIINFLKMYNFPFKKEDIYYFSVNVGKRRRINLKYNNGKYGFFEKNSNDIVQINKCINTTNKINEIIRNIQGLKFINLNSVDIFEGYNGLGINLIFNKEPNIEDFKKLYSFKNNICYINYTFINRSIFVPIIKNTDLFLNLNGFKIKTPNSFFMQATEESQNFMIDKVVENLHNCKKIADLYCGIGTYTFPLSKIAKVDCFEGDELMIKSIKNNLNELSINNVNTYKRDLFNQPLLTNELNKYDAIIINPPRNGAGNQCKFLSKSDVKTIIYISCNRISFFNDLKYFDNFYIDKIYIIDQFLWSEHLEIICVLKAK